MNRPRKVGMVIVSDEFFYAAIGDARQFQDGSEVAVGLEFERSSVINGEAVGNRECGRTGASRVSRLQIVTHKHGALAREVGGPDKL